jgi:hypothetical protein
MSSVLHPWPKKKEKLQKGKGEISTSFHSTTDWLLPGAHTESLTAENSQSLWLQLPKIKTFTYTTFCLVFLLGMFGCK